MIYIRVATRLLGLLVWRLVNVYISHHIKFVDRFSMAYHLDTEDHGDSFRGSLFIWLVM